MGLVRSKSGHLKRDWCCNNGATTFRSRLYCVLMVLAMALLIVTTAIGIWQSQELDLESGVAAMIISLIALPVLSLLMIYYGPGCTATWFVLISCFMAAAVAGLIAVVNKTRSNVGTKYCKDGGDAPPVETDWDRTISCKTARDYLDGTLANFWVVLAAIILVLVLTFMYLCNRQPMAADPDSDMKTEEREEAIASVSSPPTQQPPPPVKEREKVDVVVVATE